MEFPKWKYHPTLAAVIVDDEEAEAVLGPEWADTPAAFEDAAPEAKKKNKKA